MNKGSMYTEEFYSMHIEGMKSSAKIILDLLWQYYTPQSVIDIGCGNGAWLLAAKNLGTEMLKGMDGNWVDTELLQSMGIDFQAVDFDIQMPASNTKYDLCISVEVAEHISERNATNFINLLCNSADTILFSAAIKGQGGMHHINEQPQSYWVDLFRNHGYKCHDLFRERIWNNKQVEWWYKQNILLFTSPASKLWGLNHEPRPILDLVHPENYTEKINLIKHHTKNPSLRYLASGLAQYIKNSPAKLISAIKRQ